MLTIGKFMTVAESMDYYVNGKDTENVSSYYAAAAEGTLGGKLAEELGLSGARVGKDSEVFANLLAGRSPDGEQLVGDPKNLAPDSSRRASMDLTFNVPKSVSLAAMADPQVIDAIRAATNKVMGEVEQNHALSRQRGDTGSKGNIQTGNLCYATFYHPAARPATGEEYPDPHAHIHAVVFNATQLPGDEKKFGALEAVEIYRNQKALGTSFSIDLADKLQELGYSIKINGPGQQSGAWHSFEIDGYEKSVLDTFSKRSDEIQQKVEEIKANGGAESARPGQVAEWANLSTREKKVQVDGAKLADHWNEQAVAATGKTLKELNDGALEIGSIAQPSPRGADEIVSRVVEEIAKNKSVFDRTEILRETARALISSDRIGMDDINKAIDDYVSIGKIVDLEISRPGATSRYSTPENIQEEYYVKQQFSLRKDIFWDKNNVMESKELSTSISKYQREKGFALADGQKDMVYGVFGNRDGIVAVQGPAGTGKGVAIDAINKIGKESGIQVIGLAPTNIAAGLMRESGVETKTIDSFLANANKMDIQSGGVWLVDESSMPGVHNVSKLLALAEQYEAKVAFIGDKDQLKSVSAGDAFGLIQQEAEDSGRLVTLGEFNRPKNAMMKEVFEACSKGDFRSVATVLDRGLSQQETTDVATGKENGLTSGSLLHECDDKNVLIGQIADRYVDLTGRDKNDAGEKYSCLVVAATHADNDAINAAIHGRLVEEGRITPVFDTTALISRSTSGINGTDIGTYRPGDIIVPTTDNNSMLKGQPYSISRINSDTKEVVIKISEGKEIAVNPLTDKESVDRWDLYRPKELNIAIGGTLMIEKTNKELGLNKNERVSIVGVRENNRFVDVQTADGRKVALDRESASGTYINNGYSSTVHSAQGITTDGVLALIDKFVNGNLLNVALTRGRYLAEIFTKSVDSLLESADKSQENSSIYNPKNLNKEGGLSPGAEKYIKENGRQIEEKFRENDPLQGMIVGPAVRGFTAETATAVLKNNERMDVRSVDGVPVDQNGKWVDPSVIRELHQTDGERLKVFSRHDRVAEMRQEATFTKSSERKLEVNTGQAATRVERGVRPANIIGAKGWDITAGGVGWQWDRDGNKSFVVGYREASELARGYVTDVRTRYIKSGEDKGSVMRTVTRQSGASSRWTRDETLTRANGEKITAKTEGYNMDLGVMRFSYQRRVENLPGGGKKISESKTLGKHSWGTTTIISKDGVVQETKWAGNQTLNGGFHQTESKTTTYIDKAKAEQMKPLTDRMVKGICRQLLKAKATLTGDHKTRVEVDRMIAESAGKSGTKIVEKMDNLTGHYHKSGVIDREDGTKIGFLGKGHRNGGTTLKSMVETVLTGPNVGEWKTSSFLTRRDGEKMHVTGSTIERVGNEITEKLINRQNLGDGQGWQQLQDLKPKVSKIKAPASPEVPQATPPEVISDRLAELRESMSGDGCYMSRAAAQVEGISKSANQPEQEIKQAVPSKPDKSAEVTSRESRENVTRETGQVAPPEPPKPAEREMEM